MRIWPSTPLKYYYAAQIAQIPKFYVSQKTPLWMVLEAIDCNPLRVNKRFWLNAPHRHHLSNPITKLSLQVWDTVTAYNGSLETLFKYNT